MSLQILSRKKDYFFSVGDRVGPRVHMPIESACVSVRRVKVKRGETFSSKVDMQIGICKLVIFASRTCLSLEWQICKKNYNSQSGLCKDFLFTNIAEIMSRRTFLCYCFSAKAVVFKRCEDFLTGQLHTYYLLNVKIFIFHIKSILYVFLKLLNKDNH